MVALRPLLRVGAIVGLGTILGACAGPGSETPGVPAGMSPAGADPKEGVVPGGTIQGAGTKGAQGKGAPGKPAPGGADPAQGIGPQILRPVATADDEIGRVDDIAFHKRHFYDRFMQDRPREVRDFIELMELDALVAKEAESLEITVDVAQVERKLEAEEKRIQTIVERTPGMTFERFVQRQWGRSDREDYRAWRRTSWAREFFRWYVLGYLAMREDRVEVRYVVNADPNVLEGIATKVRQGADFATLAIKHSEGENRLEGGRLAPFARGFDHPVAVEAFRLDGGQLSEVFAQENAGVTLHYLVYCLRRIPGRELSFAAARPELDRKLTEGLLPGEFNAAVMLLRAKRNGLNSGAPGR